MKLAEIIINDFGGAPFVEHNMPCAVCKVNKAVYDLDSGYFHPCWKCQKCGIKLVFTNDLPWWKRWLLK